MAEKKRILIVDDETDFVRSTSYRLSFEGFETIEANSAEEALAVLQRTTPDLILLDVMMPGMNGVELFEQLRKDKATENMPVIFLTVWDQLVPNGSRGLSQKALLITKPFDFESLIKAIREMTS